MTRFRASVALLTVTALLLAPGASSACDPAALRAGVLRTLDARLPQVARGALERIPDPGRMLLAAHAYLRARSSLEERWSWSEAQITAFEGSPEQQRLLADIGQVRSAFEAANPGHSLYVHYTVRSLDRQIEAWNVNASVGRSGEALLTGLREGEGTCPADTDPGHAEALWGWLSRWTPQPRPNLAAPGLSRHGRARAIDFQIASMADGRIIAAADSREVETVWRAAGLDRRLADAVTASRVPFHGPLLSPDEPWHYEHIEASPGGGSPSEPLRSDGLATPSVR